MIRSSWLSSVSQIKVWSGSGTPSEIVKSVAALKLLQPAPLCVQIDGRALYRDRVHLGCDRGRSLKRLHRPNRSRVWLHELKWESGSQYHYGFGPGYLNEGLMKPRKDLPRPRAKKNWGGQG